MGESIFQRLNKVHQSGVKGEARLQHMIETVAIWTAKEFEGLNRSLFAGSDADAEGEPTGRCAELAKALKQIPQEPDLGALSLILRMIACTAKFQCEQLDQIERDYEQRLASLEEALRIKVEQELASEPKGIFWP